MSVERRNDEYQKSVEVHATQVLTSVAQASRFRRLVWMEYRAQRAFWAIAWGLLVGTELLLRTIRHGDFDLLGLLALNLPQGIGVLYAIGCAAMSFAEVHENGTATTMREHGLPAKLWVSAKLTWSLLSLSVIVLSGVSELAPESTYQSASSRTIVAWGLLARQAESEGRLDDAWSLHVATIQMAAGLGQRTTTYHLAHNSAYGEYQRSLLCVRHTAQTSERLQRAIRELCELPRFPGPLHIFDSDYQGLLRDYDAHAGSFRDVMGNRTLARWGVEHLCFNESNRERRLLQWIESGMKKGIEDLDQITLDWDRSLPDVDKVEPHRQPSLTSSKLSIPSRIDWPMAGNLRQAIAETPRLAQIPKTQSDMTTPIWGLFLQVEEQRRFLVMELAIRAYELDHGGETPTQLAHLVPQYLGKIPVEVLSGRPLFPIPELPPTQLPPGVSQSRIEIFGSRWPRSFGMTGQLAVVVNFREPPRWALLNLDRSRTTAW